MKAIEVIPQAWLNNDNYFYVLYDDEVYSVIWGKYDNQKALGVRWNGGTERGYPGQGAHPTWYVEPDFIAIAILQRLQILAIESGETKYVKDIEFAIHELAEQMTSKKNGR